MKKTKLIALTMVVALMMVGAGYAAWTDTIEINQQINTGNLDVHFLRGSNEVTTSDHMSGYVVYESDKEGGQNEYDIAKVYFKDVYPGSSFSVKLQLKNNSTMPVKLASLGNIHLDLPQGIVITPTVKVDNKPVNYNNFELPVGEVIELTMKYVLPETDNDNKLVKENHNYSINVKPIITQFNDK